MNHAVVIFANSQQRTQISYSIIFLSNYLFWRSVQRREFHKRSTREKTVALPQQEMLFFPGNFQLQLHLEGGSTTPAPILGNRNCHTN